MMEKSNVRLIDKRFSKIQVIIGVGDYLWDNIYFLIANIINRILAHVQVK